MLLEKKRIKKGFKKNTDAAAVEANDKQTSNMKRKPKKKAGGMMKMMMMSSSDEENDDDNVVHAQAAKETTDRINAELVNNGKNMFPTYHSIALSGDASDGGLNGVGLERKGAHKGKKRKSKDILFESVGKIKTNRSA